MTPNLTHLTAADHALLDSISPQRRKETLTRLAAIQQVAATTTGTKNASMTRVSDSLGVTIGCIASWCMHYRKSGIAGILPRDRPSPATQPPLTRP